MIKKYKEKGFSYYQLEIIKKAIKYDIEKTIIDEYIANPNFDNKQMEIILDGIINGLDYKLYAIPNITYEEMEIIYKNLLDNKLKQIEEQELEEIKVETKKSFKIISFSFKFLISLISIISFAAIIIFIKKYIMVDLFIKLKTEKVIFKLSEKEFNFNDYILDHTKKENVKLIIPEFDYSKNKDYIISITNFFQTKNYNFSVEILDDINPKLILKNDNIEIFDDELMNFDFKNNIALVEDNLDNLNIDDVKIDYQDLKVGENIIKYSLSDKTKNSIVKNLVLTIKEKPKPIIQNTINQTNHSENDTNEIIDNNDNTKVNNQNIFLKVNDYFEIKINSSMQDLIFLLTSDITSSSGVEVDYATVNLTVPGKYDVYFRNEENLEVKTIVEVKE